ncbi:MAG: AAA family ATPase, partial [bacterium]|nr:AAA family ATPase [bacterium]
MDRRLIPDFITDNFSKNNLSGSFKGYILFIDMVGFTSITESLFKEGKAGAEILSKLIDRVFSELINEIHLRNGFISSFAGDAFTAVFQTEDYLQVISACISLKEKMTRLDLRDLKIKRRVSVRISASYGKINWEIAGGESRKTYYFSGYPIKCSPKLQEENPGKGVILDHSIIKQITNPCIKYRRIGEREYILTHFDRDQIKSIRQSLKVSNKRTNLITPEFIDSKIINLNVKGEFREVVSLFVKFPFKTVNNDFLEFINKVLVYSEEFGGYFNGLEFGEKTPHFSVIFGAPLSFENNIERALKFFFKIKEENINISAGITSGRAYAGYIGSKQRETYTVLGNAVNLAARLMSKSKPGEILCSEALLKKLPSSFRNIKTTTEKLKGFKSNVQLFSLTKEIRLNIPSDDSQIKFIGRTEEKRKLNDRINKIESGRFGGVVTVYGEPGIGKTRLINEVLQNKSKELNIVYLKSDQLLKKGLNPFINYFSQNFFSDQTESIIEKENEFILRINKLTEFSKEKDEVTAALIEDLKVRQKYLGFLLDLFTNDPLLKSSDPKAIYQQSLIVIKDYFKILSLNRPLIIFFDDLQWIDDESIEVFRNLVRNIEDYPILIIFTSRYKDDGTKPGIDFSDEVSSFEIELLDLAENESEEFIFEYLPRDTEKKLITSIIKKGESNPFFLEQICLYIIENKIISKSNKTLHSTELEIPSEINQILISRIDRLSSKMNEIVKTASVLGLEFDIEILSRILKGIDLNRYLEMGKDARIWNELSQIQYIFRHSIMRDAVYQMQLNSHLKELHRLTGEAFEKHYSKRKDKHADKAYHFEKAEMISKAVRYYQLAGEYCSSYYRNQEALKCYEKVLHYSTERQKKLEINLKIARIQSLTGDWQSAEKRFRNILQSAKEENLKRIYLNC